MLFIHSSVEGHLGFHVFAIVNNAAKKVHERGFMWTYVFSFLGYIFCSGLATSCDNSMFNILRNYPFPTTTAPFYIPSSSV